MLKIFDLPAHPLFVHLPIVLLPLVSVLAVVAALRPRVQRFFGWWLPVMAVAVLAMVQFAMMTGTKLDAGLNLGNAAKHRHLAETTRIFAFGLVVATFGLWWFGRQAAREAQAATATSRGRQLVMVFSALSVVLALLSTVWVARTGHEGAKIHWSGMLKAK